MSIFYDGNFAVPTPTGQRRVTHPFPDDVSAFFYEQDFVQYFADFIALPLSSPDFSAFGTVNLPVYLTAESPLQDLGGGVAKWTRTFAMIPGSREEYQSFSWLRPGLSAGNSYPQFTISGGVNSGSQTTLTTSSAHGMTTGDYCLIEYTVTLANGNQLTRQIGRGCLAGTGGSSVAVSIILDASTPYYLNVRQIDQSRQPKSIVVPAYIHYDYALPGVTALVGSASAFPIFYPPLVLDSGGAETDTYAADSTPTRASYLADVAAGTLIVAEPSTIRYYKGEILERSTKYVKAI